ncbi:MAG: FG-GAP-like repeat-containing protein [bacterium]
MFNYSKRKIRFKKIPALFPILSVSYFLCCSVCYGAGEAQWQGNGVEVSTAPTNQQEMEIIRDGQGGAIMVFHTNTYPHDIRAQKIESSGVVKWAVNGVDVCAAAGNQMNPVLCSDDSGGAIFVWQDERVGDSDDDIYAQRVNAAGEPQWTGNGVVVSTPTSIQEFPAVISDGLRGAIVAWRDYRGADRDIYAQRLDEFGDPQWTANGVMICGAADTQSQVRLCSDGNNGAIITWQDYRDGNYDIYAQKISSDGSVAWMSNGIVISSATGSQQEPEIVSDKNGGAVITWEDYRGLNGDIYANHIDGGGNKTASWDFHGNAICDEAGQDQFNPKIVMSGEKAIITWHDYRTSGVADIYAQQVNESGATQWQVNGVEVCTATNNQEYPAITEDGTDGAIIAWQDLRGGTTVHIYSQRLNSAGERQWGTFGVAVCTAANSQVKPKVAVAGPAQAIIAWEDYRTDYDIYAQKMKDTEYVPPPPTVTHIFPQSGTNDGYIWDVAVYGANFKPGMMIKLQKSGSADIVGENIFVDGSGYRLSCEFDLTDKSTGTYNVFIDVEGSSAILKTAFTVNEKLPEMIKWITKVTSAAVGGMQETAYGDGDNDGDLEIYGACADKYLYKFEWSGSSWTKVQMADAAPNILNGVCVGDGDNDGNKEVYSASAGGYLYQYRWWGSSWTNISMSSAGVSMTDVAVGDGDWDGTLEVYGANTDGNLYQYWWTGSSWSIVNMGGVGVQLNGVCIGDGDNTGELKVYAACNDNRLRQYQWTGFSWAGNDLPFVANTLNSVCIGDGNNDGNFEVYGACADGCLYEYKFINPGWNTANMGGSGSKSDVFVGDGNNDGELEVYGADSTFAGQKIFQYKWNGLNYTQFGIGSDVATAMNGVCVGDGDDDGKIEVFGANTDGKIYALKPYEGIPPYSISTLQAAPGAQIKLTWLAPGDDGTNGQASFYNIRYTTYSPFMWENATVWKSSMATGGPSGTQETETVTGLKPRTTHYFVVRAYDDVPEPNSSDSTFESTVSGSFVDILAGLTGVEYGSIQWGDYDNDGDLDLAVSGYDGTNNRLIIYRNDGGGSFINASEPMGANVGVYMSSIQWGDYDNDGDLDLAVSGYDSSNYKRLIIYRNDGGGSFINVSEPMGANVGVYWGSIQWGDYDNDGDLDLAVSGLDGTNRRVIIYRNDGGGSFINISEPMGANVGVRYSSIQWGDYDNDGDLDLAVSGYDGINRRLIIYRNDGGGSFVNVSEPMGANAGVYRSSIQWGDYDNDGDLDVAVAGSTATTGVKYFRIYKSLEAQFDNENSTPTAPAGLYGNFDSGVLELRWGDGVDDKTPKKGLYYSVRVATKSITDDLESWIVSPSTGAGASPFMGNYTHGFAIAKSTQPGLNLKEVVENTTYWWQVKTIDAGLKASAWSAQQSTVPNQAPAKITALTVNPGQYVGDIYLRWTAPGDDARDGTAQYYEIKYSSKGTIDDKPKWDNAIVWKASRPVTGLAGSFEEEVITGLEAGTTYWVCIQTRDEVPNYSDISNSPGNYAYDGIKYWTGNKSSSWSNGENWYPLGIPISSDSVVIISSIPFSPSLDCDVDISSFTILKWGFSLSAGTHTMYVSGHWTDTGNFIIGTSTVVFDGSSGQNIGPSKFYNFTVNSSSKVVVYGTLDIYGDFSLNKGTVTLPGGMPQYLAGDFNRAVGTYISGAEESDFDAEIIFDGTTVQTINSAIDPLEFNWIAFTVNSSSEVRTNNNLNIYGDFTLFAGTFFAGNYEHKVELDWTQTGGNFKAEGSTVTFIGSEVQTISISIDGGAFGSFFIDSSSEVIAECDLNIDGNVEISSGVFKPGDNTHTVAGNWTQTGGTFQPSSGTINFDGTAEQQVSQFSDGSYFNNLSISSGITKVPVNGSTVTVKGNLEVNIGGRLQTNDSGRLYLEDDLIFNGDSDSNSNVTLEMNGTNLQSISGSSALSALPLFKVNSSSEVYLNKSGLISMGLEISSGVLNAGSQAITVQGNWSQSGGKFEAGTSAVIFRTGTSEVQTLAGNPFNNFQVGSSPSLKCTLTANSDLDIDGSLTISSGTFSAGSSTITIAGNWTENSGQTFDGGTGQVVFDGINQSVNAVLGSSFNNFYATASWIGVNSSLDINGEFKIGGGVFTPVASTYTVGGNWDSSVGAFQPPAGVTIVFDGVSPTINLGAGNYFNNLTINVSGTAAASTALDINNNFLLQSGTFDPQSSTHTVSGNWDDSGGSFTPAAGTIKFNGTGSDLKSGGSNNFFNLVISKTAGADTLTAASPIDVNNNLTLTSGTFDPGVYTHTIRGDWDDSGIIFKPSSGTIVLDGSGPSIKQSAGNSFHNLYVNVSDTASVRTDIKINKNLSVQSGRLNLGDWRFITVLGSVTVESGGVLFSSNNASIKIGTELIFENGSFFDVAGGTNAYTTITSTNPSIAFYRFVSSGTLDIDGLILESCDKNGLIISTGTIAGLKNVKFQSLENGAVALPVYLASGNYEFENVSFDNSISTNVRVPEGSGITEILMKNCSGAKSGWEYEEDPDYAVKWGGTLPPNAISNLTALTGDIEGEIKLSWTAPGDDGTAGNLDSYPEGKYIVKYATFQITSANFYDSNISTFSQSGSPENSKNDEGPHTITGFTPGTTYYFAIKAQDDIPNTASWSTDGVNAKNSAWAQWDVTEPGAITGFTAVQAEQIYLQWTAPGDDGYSGNLDGVFEIKYSSDSLMNQTATITLSTSCSQGANISYMVTGLIPRTTYYFTIRTADERNNWSVTKGTPSAVSGSFYDAGQNLPGLAGASCAWGDYDGDGDLDLVLIGWTGTERVSKIYENSSGVLNFKQNLIPLLSTGSLAWGDIDRDGDLDLAVCGDDGTNRRFIIYKNDGGSFSNVQEPMGAADGVSNGSLSFGDYDNDGDVDIVITGEDNSSAKISRIYENADGTFTEDTTAAASLEKVMNGSAVFGDYDNDGDLDIALCGRTDSGRVVEWYKNTDGVFSADANSEGVEKGQIAFGDYDSDGDLDLAWNGTTDGSAAGAVTRVYWNNGLGVFAFKKGLEGAYYGSLAWGDCNNDGKLDLISSGLYTDGEKKTIVYRNTGGDSPFALPEVEGLLGFSNGSLAWGDFDNDGDLDLIRCGNTDYGYRSSVMKNVEADAGCGDNVNSAPSSPTGFNMTYAEEVLTLTWSGASDSETDSDGLYYNIRVSTVEVSSSVVSGCYGTPLMGNYLRPATGLCAPGIKLKNVTENATYYWWVQTIDAGLRAGAWSTKQSTVPNQSPAAVTNLSALAGTTEGTVKLSWISPGDDNLTGGIVNGKWEIKYSSKADFSSLHFIILSTSCSVGSFQTQIVTGLTEETTYYFRMSAGDEVPNWSELSNNATAWAMYDNIPPAKITDLTAQPGEQILLTWSAPGDNGNAGALDSGSGYYIQYSTYGVFWSTFSAQIQMDASGDEPGVLKSTSVYLSQETTYYFHIWTHDEIPNWGEVSDGTTAWCYIPPAAITSLSALTAGTEGGVNLTWLAPGDDGTVGILKSGSEYFIQHSTYNISWSTSDAQIQMDASGDAPGIFKSTSVYLSQETTYYYRIWTRDEISNFSELSNGATCWVNIAPAAITTLSAVAGLSESEIDLSWLAPGDDNLTGNLVNGEFEIKYSSVSALVPYSLISLSTSCSAGSSQAHTVTGLIPSATYYFGIRTADEVPNWSGISNGATTWAQDLVPASPQNLTAVVGAGEIQLNWSANTEMDIKGYKIYYDTDTSGEPYDGTSISTPSPIFVSGKNTTFFDLIGLEWTTYWLRLKAEDNTGHLSDYTEEISTRPNPTVPAAPTTFTGLAVSTYSIKWSWTDNANNEQGYKIYSDTGVFKDGLNPDTTYWLEEGLTANTSYYRYTEAYYQSYASSSNVKIKYTLANIPWVLTLTEATTEQITLTWNGDGKDYWTQISADNITYTDLHGAWQVETSTLSKGLTPNVTMWYKVTARNGDDEPADYCLPASTATLANPPGIPAQPFTNISTYTITANWSANDNSPATEYYVECSTGDDYSVVADSSEWISAMNHTAANLSANTSYYFRAMSKNYSGIVTTWTVLGTKCTLPTDPVIWCTSGHTDDGKSNVEVFTASATAVCDTFRYYWGNQQNSAPDTDWNGSTITKTCSADGHWYFRLISRNFADDQSVSTDTFHIDYNGTKPKVEPSAVATGTNTVNITYNEAVKKENSANPGDALNQNNYFLSPYLEISSITCVSGNTFEIKTSTEQVVSTEYMISVSTNVEDEYDNPIYYTYFATATFNSWGENDAPWIVAYSTETRTDGTKRVEVYAVVNDTNDHQCQLKVEYSTTNESGPWAKCTIQAGTVDARYDDSGGAPDVDNGADFQIGASASKRIVTSFGENGCTFYWQHDSDLTAETTAYIKLSVKDVIGDSTTVITSNVVIIDNVSPSTPTWVSCVAVSTYGITYTANECSDKNGPVQYYFDGDRTYDWSSSSYTTFSDLLANTSYAINVQAKDYYGNVSGISDSTFTYTLANAPENAYALPKTTYSITWNWSSGGAQEKFYAWEIQKSTYSGWITKSSWTETGLSANTSYTMFVKARNGNLIETSSITAFAYTDIETPSGVGWVSVSTWSITMKSANDFTNLSSTGGVYFDFVSGPPGGDDSVWLDTNTYTDNGLLENFQYTYKIQSKNGEDETTGWCIDASTYTALNPPEDNELSFTVFSSSIMPAVSPPPNQSAGLTGAVFEIVTDGGNGAGFVSTGTYFYADEGLTENTTYGYQVCYKNGDGAATSFTNEKITHTLCNEPGGFVFSDSSSTFLTMTVDTFTNHSCGQAGYLFEWSSGENGSSRTWAAGASSYTDVGLSTNTAYAYRVYYRNYDGVITDCIERSTYTLAVNPLAGAFADIFISSIAVNWFANGNPSWTWYTVECSSISAGGSIFGSSVTLNTSAVFGSLDANATYYFQVKAENGNGVETGYVILGATSTLANPPVDANHSSNTATSINWQWKSGGAEKEFCASTSTTFSPNSGWTNATYWYQTNLSTNTGYTCYVKARNYNGIETSTISAIAYTSIEMPDSLAWLTVNAASIAMEALSSFSNLGDSSSAVLFEWVDGVDASSSSWISWSSYTAPGLLGNTSYTYKIKARNGDGDETGYCSGVSTYTLLNPPDDGALWVDISQSSSTFLIIKASAPANPGAGQTACEFKDFRLDTSSIPISYQWKEEGLSENTSYWFKVRYRNASGIWTSTNTTMLNKFTKCNKPAGFTMTPKEEDGDKKFKLVIDTFPNADNAPSGKGFRFNSETGPDPDWYDFNEFTTPGDLGANIQYTYEVYYRNGDGVETDAVPLSKYTLANTPEAPTASTSTVSAVNIKIYSDDGNPGITQYAIKCFREPSYGSDKYLSIGGLIQDTTKWLVFGDWGGSGGKENTGLDPSTTYYYKIIARNGDGIVTSYGNSSGKVCTFAAVPADVSHSTNTAASITWSWSSGGGEKDFLAFTETPDSSSTWTTSTLWTQTNLNTNTSYTCYVKARNHAGITTLAVSSSAYTSIETPAGLLWTEVNVSSITMSADGTFTKLDTGSSGIYFEKVDGENGFNSGWSTLTVHTITGLAENTTYSYRIMARNAEGDPTPYCLTTSTHTLLTPPQVSDVSFVTYSSSVTVNVNPPANNPYLAFTGCEFVNTSTGKNFVTTGTYSWNDTALTENTTYTYKVKYKNASGIWTSYTVGKITHTLCKEPSGFTITSASQTSLSMSVSTFTNDASGNSGYFFEFVSGGGGSPESSDGWLTTNFYTADGLVVNSSYIYRAYYRNQDGVQTYFAQITSYTLANPPIGLYANAEESTEVNLSWDPGSGGDNWYKIERSTDNWSSAYLVGDLFTSTTHQDKISLDADTTYWYRVYGYNGDKVITSSTGTVVTTEPNSPSNFSYVDISTGSITWFWQDNSKTETAYYVCTGTQARISPALEVNRSSWTEEGLSPNTSYFRCVEVYNAAGNVYSGSISSYTSACVPGVPYVFSPSTFSLALVVSTGSNPSHTEYAIYNNEESKYIQSGGTLSPTECWQTFEIWGGTSGITNTGLVANSSYTYNVKARNGDGIDTVFSSAATVIYTLIQSSPTGVNFEVGQASITVSAFGNFTNLDVPDSGVFFSEALTGKNSGWISTTTYQFSGLSPNTSHFFYIQTRNIAASPNSAAGPYAETTGIETVESLEFRIGSSSIGVAAVPSSAFTNLIEEQSGLYYVLLDTGSLILNSTWTKSGGFIDFAGLEPNTTYYFSGNSRNQKGIYNSTTTAIPGVTLANPPAGLYVSGRTNTSIELKWSENGNPGWTRYGIARSTNNFSVNIDTAVSYESNLTGSMKNFNELSELTTYWFRVWAYNEKECETAFVSVSTMTVAESIPPAQTDTLSALTGALNGTINLSWTAPADDGNDFGSGSVSGYVIKYATFSAASLGSDTTWWELAEVIPVPKPPPHGQVGSDETLTVTGLEDETMYYFILKAYDEIPNYSLCSNSAYAETRLSDSERPAKITSLSAASSMSKSIDLSWIAPGDDGIAGTVSGYVVKYATFGAGGDTTLWWPGANVTASSKPPPHKESGLKESWTVTGLENSTTYYFAVRSYDERDNTSPSSNEARENTGILEITYFRPADGSLGVAVGAEILIGFSKLMSTETVKSAMRIKAVKDNMGRSTDTVVSPSSFSWIGSTFAFISLSLMNNYTYGITISSMAAKDLSGAYLEETQSRYFTTIMARNSENVVLAQDPGGKELYRIELEPGALPVDAYVKISTSPAENPIRASVLSIERAEEKTPKFGDAYQFSIPGTMREFNAYDAGGEYRDDNFAAEVKITIPYKDKGNGIVDETSPPIRERTLSIYWLDEAHNLWVRIPSSEVDEDNNTVSATVKHFSVYTIMGTNLWDLSAAYAFPVPYIAGKDANGKPTVPPETITFSDLSDECTIKIYTITGELVRTIKYPGDGGKDYQISWNLKNDNGEDVASEVYIYYIHNAKQHKTGKLIIIR